MANREIACKKKTIQTSTVAARVSVGIPTYGSKVEWDDKVKKIKFAKVYKEMLYAPTHTLRDTSLNTSQFYSLLYR